jgi:hypothetical protein
MPWEALELRGSANRVAAACPRRILLPLGGRGSLLQRLRPRARALGASLPPCLNPPFDGRVRRAHMEQGRKVMVAILSPPRDAQEQVHLWQGQGQRGAAAFGTVWPGTQAAR